MMGGHDAVCLDTRQHSKGGCSGGPPRTMVSGAVPVKGEVIGLGPVCADIHSLGACRARHRHERHPRGDA
jgi:hypothetical protein